MLHNRVPSQGSCSTQLVPDGRVKLAGGKVKHETITILGGSDMANGIHKEWTEVQHSGHKNQVSIACCEILHQSDQLFGTGNNNVRSREVVSYLASFFPHDSCHVGLKVGLVISPAKR